MLNDIKYLCKLKRYWRSLKLHYGTSMHSAHLGELKVYLITYEIICHGKEISVPKFGQIHNNLKTKGIFPDQVIYFYIKALYSGTPLVRPSFLTQNMIFHNGKTRYRFLYEFIYITSEELALI